MSVENPAVSPVEESPKILKPAAAPATTDLSREVERAVERKSRDRVRCVRVFEDYYRCNWWAPAAAAEGPLPEWSATALHRVRKSRFLRVTNGPCGLCIEQVAGEDLGAAE